MNPSLPDFRLLPEKTLIGMHLSMSFSVDLTPQLWRSFMPRRREILHPEGTELYSLQLYPAGFFDSFSPSRTFEKWAAVAVPAVDRVPEGMEVLQVPAGLYAVFLHLGGPARGPATFGYIFQQWLPASGYILDDRPHFELLGEKYKNNDQESEEEIWIPVKAV